MEALRQSLLPLRQREFRLLWSSSLAWYFARWMDVLVAAWLALELTNSVWHVALIGFCRHIPVLLFGAFAGAVADRVDRRLLVITTEVTNVAASAAIAALFLLGQLEYWHLALANLALGLAWSIEWPTRRAIIPDLVGRDLLVPAVIVDGMSMNFNKVLGPLAGGGLIATLGIGGCYVMLTVIYCIGLVPLLLLRTPRRGRSQAASTYRFLLEGISFCHRYQAVRGVLLITVAMNFFVFPHVQLLPVFARDVLFVGPLALGMLAAADGIGSLLGAFGLMVSSKIRRHGLLFVMGSLITCAGTAMFAASPLYALSLLVLILGGIGHAGFSTFQSTIILGAVGDSLRGRAMGILTLAIGTAPVGMLIMGGVAAALGAPWAVGLSSIAGGLMIALSIAVAPGLLAQRASPPQHPAAAPARSSVSSAG